MPCQELRSLAAWIVLLGPNLFVAIYYAETFMKFVFFFCISSRTSSFSLISTFASGVFCDLPSHNAPYSFRNAPSSASLRLISESNPDEYLVTENRAGQASCFTFFAGRDCGQNLELRSGSDDWLRRRVKKFSCFSLGKLGLRSKQARFCRASKGAGLRIAAL